MLSFMNFSTAVIMAVILTAPLSACQVKPDPVKPTAEQHAALKRLHKNCIAASPGKEGRMLNLARLRKKQSIFTCDEMQQLCESDYASEMCKGMMTVAAVENAHQKACRTSRKAAASSACRKLSVCNVKGFEAPECTSVIARFNR